MTETRGGSPRAPTMSAEAFPAAEEEQKVPESHFDAYAVLTILKFIGDIAGIFALFANDFVPGGAVAAIGLGTGVLLRFVGNMLMKIELEESGITTKPWSLVAFFNTFIGTRFGFKGDFVNVANEAHEENLNSEEIVAPKPVLYGQSETVRVGPRTLTAIAEVIGQGFLFYPALILFLEFGFDGDVDFIELIMFSAMVSFAQIMCWLVSPYINVTYGYVYLATWLSFTLPFLLILLISVAVGDFVEDSYYTNKEIYAWTRLAIVLVFGVIGLAIHNSSMQAMHRTGEYKITHLPAMLYFQQVFSAVALVFEVISLVIVLAFEKAFFFGDDEEIENSARINAIVLANTVFAGWTLIVATVEGVTVKASMSL